MASLNECVREYTSQLSKGLIQEAYRGIMTFMSDLRTYLERRHEDYATSALYFGYMDMTFFAFTPSSLRSRKLKIAIVFLHRECSFEIWLTANNRQLQADYIELLSHKDTGGYHLSKTGPGVDSIIASPLVEHPDFDALDELKSQIEVGAVEFVRDVSLMLGQC